MEFPFEHRPVNIAQLLFRGLVFDAHDNPIGMQKVSHCCAFAQEFRIGGHMKGDVGLAGVHGQSALQLLAGTRRNGAFLDDQFWRFRLRRHQPCYVVDGTQVRLAAGQRRSAHADESSIAVGDGLRGIGAEFQPALFVHARNDLFEPRFIDGKPTGFENLDLVRVAIGARHFVADFRETGPGDKAHVSRADYDDLQ